MGRSIEMKEVSDVLSNHPSVALVTVIAYWMTQLIGHVNEIVSTLTGIGALFLLCLTIVGKWNEIQDKRKNKGNG